MHMRVMGVGMQDGQQPVNWTVATHINPTPRVIEDLKLARQKRCSLPSPPPGCPRTMSCSLVGGQTPMQPRCSTSSKSSGKSSWCQGFTTSSYLDEYGHVNSEKACMQRSRTC